MFESDHEPSQELTEWDIEFVEELRDGELPFERSNPMLPTVLDTEPVTLPQSRQQWLEELESAKTRVWIRPYAARF